MRARDPYSLPPDSNAGQLPCGAFRHDPPTITAGLRVKNGGLDFAACLRRLETLVDEIVVLDDGSTDDTLEICRSCPRVTRLLSWPKDFAHEGMDRTVVLAMMADTGADWFLVPDADEVYEDRADLRPLAADLTVGAWTFRRFDFWLCRTQYRVPGLYGDQTKGGHRGMFRNVPGLRYPLLPVHCSVPHGVQGPWRDSGIRIKHYGFSDPERARQKFEEYDRAMPGALATLTEPVRLVEWVE